MVCWDSRTAAASRTQDCRLPAGRVRDSQHTIQTTLRQKSEKADKKGKKNKPLVCHFHRRHLSPEWRRERVKELHGKGMSTREIAKEVGTSQATVRNDLKSGEQCCSPDAKHESTTTSGEKETKMPARQKKKRGRPKKQPAAKHQPSWADLVCKVKSVLPEVMVCGESRTGRVCVQDANFTSSPAAGNPARASTSSAAGRPAPTSSR